VLLVAASGFCLELLAREQASAQGLPDRHRELLGLDAVGDVEERSRRRGEGQSVAPDGRDVFSVGMGVGDHTHRPAQAPVSARDEQMHGVGDAVAEVEQRQGALVGEQRRRDVHRDPRLAHLVVLGARKALDAVQRATDTLEAPAAQMMVEELAADVVRTSLAGVKVAALLVCLGFQCQDISLYIVRHKTSIA